MGRIYESFVQLIGNTPILHVNNYEKAVNSQGELFTKLEYFNPCSSVKDRVGYAIIREAVASGQLQPGGTIVEATSGNTGIALAAVGTAMGFKVIIVMPDTMSVERRKLILGYGAELVLTEGAKGMKGAIAKAKEIVEQTTNSIEAGQFVNRANPQIHYETTGPEIWDAMDGQIDVFVAGVGTGGTISGTGKFLKEKNPDIKIIAVEPVGSPVLSKGESGPHKIQGIGAGFVPEVLNTSIYDEIITVEDENAFEAARCLGHTEGILVGISSGAALWAATEVAKQDAYKGKRIVVLLPDTGERYLSTPLFPVAD